MRTTRFRRAAVALGCAALLALGACSTNPATGEQSFTAFMSPQDEVRIGSEQHPKILEQFGGALDDPEIGGYVATLGARLAAVSDRPDINFTFTVLNSPIVNAFALPGGYVYISRGLMALANNEAELAGVIGHEIGHVTARHSAERYSRSVLVGLGAGILGAVTGQRAIADLANVGAGLYIQSYSRSNEFEADSLGLRYMTRIGYDPRAVADFLSSLGATTRLEAKLRGSDSDPDAFNLLATHPRTLDRVREAQEATGTLQPGRMERDTYLRKIDGLLYGDDPQQGFIRDRLFVHPVLGFEFTVPPGFILMNSSNQVVARNRGGTTISFSGAVDATGRSMAQYLGGSEWTSKLRLANLESFTVNGMDAATAATALQTQKGVVSIRLVAIRASDRQIYRFVFAGAPNALTALSTDLQRTTYSFKLLSESEAAAYKPHRLRIVQVRPGDTVDSLATRMPAGPEQRARFLVLNGLEGNEAVTPGQLIKIVTE